MQRQTFPILTLCLSCLALLAGLLAGCSLGATQAVPPATSAGMAEYRRFAPETEAELATAVAVGDVRAGYAIAKVAADFDLTAFGELGFDLISSYIQGESRYARLRAHGRTVERLAALAATPGVYWAEHELAAHTHSLDARAAPQIMAVLNDPLTWGAYGHFETTRAIDAYRDIGFGPNTVYAAGIDTGINRLHEEFTEQTGRQIVVRSRSAFQRNPDGSFTDLEDGNILIDVPEHENWDDNGHGTHTAGIMGALGNNGLGIAGVAWKNLRLISYKGLSGYSGTDWTIYTPLQDLVAWKKTQGITQTIPVTMSLGESFVSSYMLEMLDLALSNGILIIASMGNESRSEVKYPAAVSGVIAVGATMANGQRASFSTMGRHISVMAPGYNILSTTSRYHTPGDTSSYEDMSGTSMSAPFVTGLVALMLGWNPHLESGQIKALLESTATDMGSPGWDTETGFGQVDVEAALQRVRDGNIQAPGSVYCTTTLKVFVHSLNPHYDSGLPGHPQAVAGEAIYLYDVADRCVAVGMTGSVDGSTSFHLLKPGRYRAVINHSGQKTEGSVIMDQSADQNIVLEVDVPAP